MENLIKALSKESNERLARNIAEVEESTSIKDSIITRYTTKTQREKFDLDTLKEKVITKLKTKSEKSLNSRIESINSIVENTSKVKEIKISIKWIKNRTWGYCPKSEIELWSDEGYERYTCRTVTGYGFCKLSTAIANLLMESNNLVAELYTIKNKPRNINIHNHGVFGYGSGYGILPYFEGGVGERSILGVLENLNFKLVSSNSTATTNFYHLKRK